MAEAAIAFKGTFYVQYIGREDRFEAVLPDEQLESLSTFGISPEQYQAGLDKWLDDPAYRNQIQAASPTGKDLGYHTIPPGKFGEALQLLAGHINYVPNEDRSRVEARLTDEDVEMLRTIGVSREQFQAAVDRSCDDPIYAWNGNLASISRRYE